MGSPIKFSLRYIAFCLLMMLVLPYFGEPLIKPLLPLYKWEIGKVADEFRIISFNLENRDLERVIRMKVTLTKPIRIAGHSLMPDARGVAEASTSLSHIWQMAVLCFAMIFAWPTKLFRTYFVRLAIAIPWLVAFSMLDTPLALLAAIWDLILINIAPGNFSPLITWNSLLEGGGRLALGLVAGMLSLWITQMIEYSYDDSKVPS